MRWVDFVSRMKKKKIVGFSWKQWGFLLSLSLCDFKFSLSDFFSNLQDVPHDTIDTKISEFYLWTIKYPKAPMILLNPSLPQLTGASWTAL